MSSRKPNRSYCYTAEGETEVWYLKWLEEQINIHPDSKFTVTISAKTQPNPEKFAKTVNPISTTKVVHLCDCESEEETHVKRFEQVLSQLKKINESRKSPRFYLGYSNYAFELWIILHKVKCNGSLASRTHYLTHINKAFGANFRSLSEYKEERNFKKCLSKLCLEDVKTAVSNAMDIIRNKERAGYKPREYKRFKYFRENPALNLWEHIGAILVECGLMQKEDLKL